MLCRIGVSGEISRFFRVGKSLLFTKSKSLSPVSPSPWFSECAQARQRSSSGIIDSYFSSAASAANSQSSSFASYTFKKSIHASCSILCASPLMPASFLITSRILLTKLVKLLMLFCLQLLYHFIKIRSDFLGSIKNFVFSKGFFIRFTERFPSF